MKFTLFLFFILTNILSVFGQGELQFNPSIKPNSRYRLIMYKNVNQIIKFEGTDKQLKELAQYGITNPIETKTDDTSSLLIVSGQLHSDGSFPVRVEQKVVIGYGVPDDPENKLTFFGAIDGTGNITIDSLLNDSSEDEYTKGIIKIIDIALKRIYSPLKSIKPNDTVTVDFPMFIAVSTFSIDVNFRTQYLLGKSSQGFTELNTKEEISFNSSVQNTPITIEGSGTGVLRYNNKTGGFDKYTTNMKMTLGTVLKGVNTKVLLEEKGQFILMEEKE